MADWRGIINVYKEKEYTSHDVVAVVRKILRGAKAGHTGTLDPMAEGVLPVCVGKATKLADYIAAGQKSYRAVVRLGVTTDTLDAAGAVLCEKPVLAGETDILEAVASFKGPQLQTPPMYSAVKVGGRKLYDIARKGGEVERKPREITIFGISVLKFLDDARFELDVTCSKGTYIRSLCADIGEKLGCGAHMEALVRTRSGQFTIENSVKLSDVKALAEAGEIERVLMPMEAALADYTRVDAPEALSGLLKNGNKFPANRLAPDMRRRVLVAAEGERLAVFNATGSVCGIYEPVKQDGQLTLKPVTILL